MAKDGKRCPKMAKKHRRVNRIECQMMREDLICSTKMRGSMDRMPITANAIKLLIVINSNALMRRFQKKLSDRAKDSSRSKSLKSSND